MVSWELFKIWLDAFEDGNVEYAIVEAIWDNEDVPGELSKTRLGETSDLGENIKDVTNDVTRSNEHILDELIKIGFNGVCALDDDIKISASSTFNEFTKHSNIQKFKHCHFFWSR